MASRRDATGSLVGLAVFLGGVALLALTFKLAYEQFNVPHAQKLGLEKGKALDLGTAGSFADILIQLGFLLVMAVIGSFIANKGIGLYSGSLHPVDKAHEPIRVQEEGEGVRV